jgi:tRNA-intron endonuclease
MEAQRRDGRILVGGDARQRFHDASGYGRPLADGRLELAPVEAAHLLFRGDLDSVASDGFRAFLTATPDLAPRFLVYTDLRDRGFYLAPAREGWVDTDRHGDLVVFERGEGPPDGTVAHHVRTVGETTLLPAADLGDVVVAVADGESEITYFDTDRPDLSGTAAPTLPDGLDATLLSDRVVVWDAAPTLHDTGFFGQPLDDGLVLSLTEAAYLADTGAIAIDGGRDAVRDRGHTLTGEHFDRRVAVYSALRSADIAPKTGYKFGADFRTYPAFSDPDDLGHSESLVVALDPSYRFSPRELSLYVRLAGGVRKRMVFALTDANDGTEPTWLSVRRLTP